MNVSDDIVVEEDIPETISPNQHNRTSPRNSPIIDKKASIIEELVDGAEEDNNIKIEEEMVVLESDHVNIVKVQESIVTTVNQEMKVMKSVTTPPPPSKKKLTNNNNNNNNNGDHNKHEVEKTEEKQLSPHSLSVQELIKTTQNLIGNLDIQLPKDFGRNRNSKHNKKSNKKTYNNHNSNRNTRILIKQQQQQQQQQQQLPPSVLNSTFKTAMPQMNISKRDLQMQQQMDTTAAVSAARDIMAERARDRMLKKEHDKLVARLLKEKEEKAKEDERKRKHEHKRQVIERERSERMQNVKRWQIERDAAAKSKLEKLEQNKQRKLEQKLKLKEARKKRKKRKKLEDAKQQQQQQYNSNLPHSPSNMMQTPTTLGSEPGSDNFALDSMISQYISISSGLRAQLHITELRLASRARVSKRGRELDAESSGAAISSPSKTEKAYDIVSRVRKLLSTVDEELPTLHHLLSDVEFLAKPKLTRSAIKEQYGGGGDGSSNNPHSATPPIVRKSQEVLRSVINFEAKSPEMRSSRSLYGSNNKRRSNKNISTSPGQASSAFLDFNEIASQSKNALQYDNNDSNEDDIGDDNDANSDWEVNAIRNQKKHNRGRHSAKHSPTYKSKSRKSGSSSKKHRDASGSHKSKSARSSSSLKNHSASSHMPKISKSLSVAEIRAIKQKKLANGGLKLAFHATRTTKRAGANRGGSSNNGDSRREDEIRKVKKVRKKKKLRTKKKIKKAQALSIVDDDYQSGNNNLIESNNRFDDYNGDGDGGKNSTNNADGGGARVVNSRSTSDLSKVYENHPGITFIP